MSPISAWLATNNPLSALAVLTVDKLADWLLENVSLPEDSGLMVFSRYPINGQGFESYASGAAQDWLTDKGVAHVVIGRSLNCDAHIFLSHMQSSYDSAEQYDDQRQGQLAQAAKFIESLAPADSWDKRIITAFCGDFNIHGDAPPRPEWERVFVQGQPTAFYSTGVWDAWDEFVSPANGRVTDLGITNHGEGRASRLDYVVLRRRPWDDDPPNIVAQQMLLAHPGVSDHIGVKAELNIRSEHCYPADARPITDGAGYISAELEYGGKYWLFFDGGGTWSFLDGPFARHTVFSVSNMSQLLGPRRYTDLKKIDDAKVALAPEGQEPGETLARTYAIPGPFLVMIDRPDDETGWINLGYYRHLGTSRADAICVQPQCPPVAPDFAALAKSSVHGAMEFWFEAKLYATRFNQDLLTWRFELHNPTGEQLDLDILRSHNNDVLGHITDTAAITKLAVQNTFATIVYAVVRLSHPAQVDWSLGLRSPLTFLLNINSHERILLKCDDETGTDAFGDDEISLTMRPDSAGGDMTLLKETEGVFTGREIPISPPTTGDWKDEETAFQYHLEVKITEAETVGDDVDVEHTPALEDAAYEAVRTIALSPGTGDYSLRIHLAREPGSNYSPPP